MMQLAVVVQPFWNEGKLALGVHAPGNPSAPASTEEASVVEPSGDEASGVDVDVDPVSFL